MPKTGRAPKGFYSASQVMRKLGIASSTLYHFVDTGRIKKVVPPNMRDGYYIQEDVDKMARERELFIFTQMKDTSKFRKAVKDDILGIYEVTTSLWGDRVPSYDARLSSFQQNPSIYYVVEKENIVIGFLGLIPFSKDALDKVMSEAQTNFSKVYQDALEQKGNVIPFKSGEPINSLFLDIAVKKGVPNDTLYGMRLIQGCIEVLEGLAREGIVVKKLHASSSSPDGIRLCKGFGFAELPKLTETTRLRFELDLETSNSPYVKEYQKILKQLKSSNKKVSHSA
jgi:hypothetical protein